MATDVTNPVRVQLGTHLRERSRKRHIRLEQIKLVIQYGRCIQAANAQFFFFGRIEREIWSETLGEVADTLEDIVVVMTSDGAWVKTVYRNSNAMRIIKHKQGTWYRPKPHRELRAGKTVRIGSTE